MSDLWGLDDHRTAAPRTFQPAPHPDDPNDMGVMPLHKFHRNRALAGAHDDAYGAEESHAAVRATGGDPDAPVTIYRALPVGHTGIRPGDWVSTERKYVDWLRQRPGLEDNYRNSHVVQTTVPAKHLYGYGDPVRWGYHGPAVDGEPQPDSRTAATDGIRYAAVVEADVADDLRRLAMPAVDAYDTHIKTEHRDTDQSIKPGPYFHATDQLLNPGDVILPLRDVREKIPTARGRQQNYSDMGYENHADWVWMMRHPAETSNYGKYVYHVQPEVEGPWSWNNAAHYDGDDYSNHRYVAPRARVIQQMHPDEHGYYPFPDTDDDDHYHIAARLAAVSDDVVDRLHNEFSDWYDHAGHVSDDNLADRQWAQDKYDLPDKGPISHWPNIENFLHDRYPAAHRGLRAGMEHAGPLLDGKEPWSETEEPASREPYQTGPDAVAEHGYDPKGVAAAFMLMHLKAHGTRDQRWPGITDEAQQRLVDVFDKRQQMQRDYEQRNARLAMAWPDWTGKIKGGCTDCSPGTEGRYVIPQAGAFLNYKHGPGEVRVGDIYTHPSNRQDGAAEALMRRLVDDHPGVHINPGYMTNDGQKFHDRMVDKEPIARDVLAGLNGELPENLSFQHHPEGFAPFPDVIQPQHQVSNAFPTVSAHDGDRMVGHLQWDGDHPRHKGRIWDIRVHPDYQRRGVGTAMFDWATDQIEPDLHHSHNLSDEGEAFMKAEIARPLADQRYEAWQNGQPLPKRFAMAWQDWAPKIEGYCKGCDGTDDYGEYFIKHPPGQKLPGDDGLNMSSMSFYHDTGKDGQPEIGIAGLHTDSNHRHDGVAEAMLRRLHEDHPGVRINPGFMTDDGQAFHDRMLNKEPVARNVVTAGANGDLPPLTFEPFNTMWSNGIMARHAADGRPVGHLHWYPDGEIESVRVHPDFQRRGVANAMLGHANADPNTYDRTETIHHSNHLSAAGRAWAFSDGHMPHDDEVEEAHDDPHAWGWTAVKDYTPANVPYTGQNEAEMSKYLDQPWIPPTKTASAGDGWPVWWRGKHRPGVEFDKRWHPNHPHHIPAPWDN